MGEEGFFTLPAYQVEVVDTVGAGDVFHGAFIAGLLQGYTTKETARLASAVSAVKCTRIGGRAGIPDWETVREFMETGRIDYREIEERIQYYKRGRPIGCFGRQQTFFTAGLLFGLQHSL